MFLATDFCFRIRYSLSNSGMQPSLVLSLLLFYSLFLFAPLPALAQNLKSHLLKINQLKQKLENNAEDIDLLWTLARTYQRAGNEGTSKEDRIKYYTACQDYAQKGIAVNKDSAQAHFWLGICYGKEANIKGFIKGLSLAGKIRQEMERVVELDPACNHAGGHRALGRLLFKLPGFLGGSLNEAVLNLKEAVRIAPDFSTNRLYLAEAYLKKKKYPLAYEELQALLQLPLDPQREKTMVTEKKKAEKLLKKIPPQYRR